MMGILTYPEPVWGWEFDRAALTVKRTSSNGSSKSIDWGCGGGK
jgi:hypothetical protein